MCPDYSPLQILYTRRSILPSLYSPPRHPRAPQSRVYSVGRGLPGVVCRCWPLPTGGRGPPGRQRRRELQALSNSLQLTSI